MKYLKFIIIFLIIVVYKLLRNFSKYVQCLILLGKYKRWCRDPYWKFVENKQTVISLFKDAGLHDSHIPVAEPIGYSLVQPGMVSLFENFPNNSPNMTKFTITMFHEAIGVYKHRMIDAINPMYWISSIIFLPKNILIGIGVKPENISIKILQFLYWLAAIILGLYIEEIKKILIRIL